MTMFTAWIDGGSRGNPGPAAAGWWIRDDKGVDVCQGTDYLGEQTNNAAEYYALEGVLKQALGRGIQCLHVKSDSKLVVKQIQCAWAITNPTLQRLAGKCWNLMEQFQGGVTMEHIRREFNERADELVNITLDIHKGSPDS
jgi:ribonuclease HI